MPWVIIASTAITAAWAAANRFAPETVRMTIRQVAAESTPGGSTAEPDGLEDEGP